MDYFLYHLDVYRVHKFLPYYYSIGGRARDGFTYVLYLNGGHGVWGLHEYVQHFCEVCVLCLINCCFSYFFQFSVYISAFFNVTSVSVGDC